MIKSESDKQNFFSKIYTSLENGYINFSNWFTKKGINLNALNNKLEEKGIPAFPLMGSILLIIIFLILFLFVFNISSSTQVTFKLMDSYSKSIDSASISIKDIESGDIIFSDIVENNQQEKIKLKVGDSYLIQATKDGYPDYSSKKIISSQDEFITISFNESIKYGLLTLNIIDKDNKKIIPLSSVKATYIINGEEKTIELSSNLTTHKIDLELPIKKDIELVISADQYEDLKIDKYRLLEEKSTKIVEMVVSSAIEFEGKSKVTFVVVDKENNPLTQAAIEIYNPAQERIFSTITTSDGKALAVIDTGETISYKVSKEEYRTYVSDDSISNKILNKEKTINVQMEYGGSFLDIIVMDATDFITIENAEITLYNLEGKIIDSNFTAFDGMVSFSGLETDANIIVSACKYNFFCENLLVSLSETNHVELKLNPITTSNSAILDIFVVDGKNLALPKAKVRIYEINDQGLELPYGNTRSLDVTGSLSIPLKVGQEYLVKAFIGDVYDYETIKISDISGNKIIFVLAEASKVLNLDLLNPDGTKIIDGHLLIKTKDGTVLYDQDVNRDSILFGTEGYNDFITEYTDTNGNTTTSTFSADQADPNGMISVEIRNEIIGDYPVIEFIGIEDSYGQRTNFLSKNKDYYLVFDVIFPKGITEGGVHIRAGDDSQTDIENMSYGITGFKSDTKNFTYSTTYSPLPEPGNSSIDVLNKGSAGILNKWLELKWKGDKELGTKQIRIKVNAIDTSVFKLKYKYRAWSKYDGKTYRDPIDNVFGQEYTTQTKQALYANTKEVVIDLFDVPLDCDDELCVSHEFIDTDGITYPIEEFFALKDDVYAVKSSFFSYKNTTIDLKANTSTTQPIISFVSIGETQTFPSNVNYETVSELSTERNDISLKAGVKKTIYTFFVAKNIGTAYIDLDIFNSLNESKTNKRISFNINQKRNLRVVFNPDLILPYGSKLDIEIYDSANGNPIENALIIVEDEHNQFIRSIKGNKLNGKSGKYTLNADFVVNKLNIKISAYGYTPTSRQLLVADNSILLGPDEVLINMGTEQITAQSVFILENAGDFKIENISFGEVIWVQEPDDLTLDTRGPITIMKNSKAEFQIIATTSQESQFTSALAKLPVYGSMGNRQVARIIPIRISRGLIEDNCIVIKPKEINTYVGINNDYEFDEYYNAPYTDYTYNNSPNFNYNNPNTFASSTNYNTYEQYFNNNYSQKNTGVDNLTLYDNGFSRFLSSKLKNTKDYSENTIGVLVQNTCDKTITLNPQLVELESNSNNELDIGLNQLIIQPGEEKYYDISIKNLSDRKQTKKYSYNILWNNSFYSLEPTQLNVELLDLSNALWATPQIIYVPMSQLTEQQPAITSNRFFIKNIGNVNIRNIQISRYPQMLGANIGVTEYPREISVLEPGKMIPIDLKFQVNVNKTTYDDMYFVITGKADGINNPIVSYTQIIFIISSPNCLKVSPDKLNYSLNIGEKRSRNISVTNECSEPVSIVGIDKSGYAYTETFGQNNVSIIPYGTQVIPVNGTADFAINMVANNYGGSPSMPVTLIGRLMQSGQNVTSEKILTSINILPTDSDKKRDKEQTTNIDVPVCEDNANINNLDFPIIAVGDCTGNNGYCDAYGVANLIAKKINELSTDVFNTASQFQNKVKQTGCSTQKAMQGYCPIQDIGGNIQPLEFSFYMQNDTLSPDLLREILNNSNYKFKDYLVQANPYESLPDQGIGVYQTGNKIFMTNKINGCGRFKVEIDGFIAANAETLYPDRAYYYINFIEAEQTDQCTKKITNYMNYLPWDLELKKNNSKGTWLTTFSGNKEIALGVIDSINKLQKDQDRYVESYATGTKHNHLHISVGKIEEDKEALAKVYFNDYRKKDISSPEQINIVINNRYEYEDNKLPEKVIKDSIYVISSLINKDDYAKICVAKDKSYILIKEFIDAGTLEFNPSEYSAIVKDGKQCIDINISSDISETLRITANASESIDISFNSEKQSQNNVKELVLTVKKNKPEKFEICYSPKDSSKIYNIVNQDIELVARSIYNSEGKVGQREANAIVHLETCGVTPLKALSTVSNDVLKQQDSKNLITESTYYSLVDWNTSYNSNDTEDICETIKKFIGENKDSEMFFDYKSAGCQLESQEAESDARWNKALSNSGNYYSACMINCSICTLGVDAIISWIPGLGQAKIAKDILLDCGIFSCGIPAAGVMLYTGSGQNNLAEAIDKTIGNWITGPVLGNDNPKFARGIVSTFNKVFGGSTENLIESAAGTTTSSIAAGTRMKRAVPLGKTKISEIDESVKTIINDPNSFISSKTTGGTTGGVKPLSTTNVKMLSKVESRLGNYVNYMKDGKIYSHPDPAKVNKVLQKVTINGVYDPTKVKALSSTEFDDLLKIINEGTFTDNRLNPKSLINELNKYGTKKYPNYKGFVNPGTPATATTTGTTGQATTAATTSSVKHMKIDEYDNVIKSFDDQIGKYDKSIKAIDDKIAQIETSGGRFNRSIFGRMGAKKEIEKLKATKSANIKSKESLEKLKSSLTNNVKKVNNPSGPGQVMQVSDDAVNDISKFSRSSGSTTIRKASTRWSKFKNFSSGFVRGMFCGILGNIAGANKLKEKGLIGLDNSILIPQDFKFEKNTLYEIGILDVSNKENQKNRYKLDITKFSPNLTNINLDQRIDNCGIKTT